MQSVLVFNGFKWADESLALLPDGLEISMLSEKDLSRFELVIHADFSPYAISKYQFGAHVWHLVNCFYASIHDWEKLNPGLNQLAGVKLHPAFLAVPSWEFVCTEQKKQQSLAQLLGTLNIQPHFVEDGPCTTSARLVVMIINEAFLTLSEGVANEADIDLAMKLGTGYPFGPFEWATHIGNAEALRMLKTLQAFHQSIRYQPAPLLAAQAND